MVKIFFLIIVLTLLGDQLIYANNRLNEIIIDSTGLNVKKDTIYNNEFTIAELQSLNQLNKGIDVVHSVDIKRVNLFPYSNLADFLKGQNAGVYVQQISAEAGSFRNLIVRGNGGILLNNSDLNISRAVLFVNNIPVSNQNNFAFDIQQYKYDRIGPSTDNFNFIDISSIESIEIVKDPAKLAFLGPLAANGAISIITKGGKSGKREFSINSYYGLNSKPNIIPINAEYENLFRKPFYALYNKSLEVQNNYPGYLADSTNLNYYGPSKWFEKYYDNASLYSIDLSLRGGSDRANFSFFGSHTKNATTADNNNLKRYNLMFNVNIMPFEWLMVSTFLHGNRTDRIRNRSLRDRYSEMGYLPDLSIPLSPNLAQYDKYLSSFDKGVNENLTNSFLGNFSLSFDFTKYLSFVTSFKIDYQEGLRDVFYPSELMNEINYNSNYFGYSQRYLINNSIKYLQKLSDNHSLVIQAGLNYLDDSHKFNYAKSFDGANDFIKLNVVEGDPNKSDYLRPRGGIIVDRWYNKAYNKLLSTYGSVQYDYKNILNINGIVRWDASSSVQPNFRWLFTPSLAIQYNLNKHLSVEDEFSLRISAGRLGQVNYDSKLAVGPQYYSNMSYSGASNVNSFYSNSGLSRPYDRGWVGYNLNWSYVDQIDFTVNKSFLSNRLNMNASIYKKANNNQIVSIPLPAEYGYKNEFKNGLSIENNGVDVNIAVQVIQKPNGFNWSTGANVNYNTNKIKKLPDGLSEIIVGNRLLKVGESADAFWLYENLGIYNSIDEIPTISGNRLRFDGVDYNIGDPKYKDQNNDFEITEEDKILKGNSLPKIFGGFNNRFSYKGIDLGVDLYFALGHNILNERASNKYNFIYNESNNSINSIREIFQWQQDIDITKYPRYNVWSSINPYRVDQDLFLEDATFLKIRAITLGYDLTNKNFLKSIKSLRKAYIYLTADNIYTFSKFSGLDPELTNINGFYDGYALPLTPTFTLGLKLDF